MRLDFSCLSLKVPQSTLKNLLPYLWASSLASSVLPTPVGPTNNNEEWSAMLDIWSSSVSMTTSMACSCPMMRFLRNFRVFSISPDKMLPISASIDVVGASALLDPSSSERYFSKSAKSKSPSNLLTLFLIWFSKFSFIQIISNL